MPGGRSGRCRLPRAATRRGTRSSRRWTSASPWRRCRKLLPRPRDATRRSGSPRLELVGVAVDTGRARPHVGRDRAPSRDGDGRDLRARRRPSVQHRLSGWQLREVLFERLKLSTKGVRSLEDGPLDRRGRPHQAGGRASAPGEDPRNTANSRSSNPRTWTRCPRSSIRRPGASTRRSTRRVRRERVVSRAPTRKPPEHPDPHRGGTAHPRRRSSPAPGVPAPSRPTTRRSSFGVLAHLADDAALIDAFTRGDDIHARTAADVFGSLASGRGPAAREGDQLRDRLRPWGPARAARELGVSMKEADTYIREYFAALRRASGAYLDATVAEARRARLRDHRSSAAAATCPSCAPRDPGVRQFAERGRHQHAHPGVGGRPHQARHARAPPSLCSELAPRRRCCCRCTTSSSSRHRWTSSTPCVSSCGRRWRVCGRSRFPCEWDVRDGADWAEAH